MARNVKLQILRGVEANRPSDLAMGELYFGTDTGNLFVGTPGYGLGFIQVGNTTDVNETLQAVLAELRSIRAALVALACDGGKNRPEDFEPDQFSKPLDQEN